jgi:hypothetical protein
MVDETSGSIVERLKQEGQLIRNTGTNSIKAVRTDLARFNDIFVSINDNLIQQTQILRETLQLQLEQADRAERARQLEEVTRTEPTPIPSPRLGATIRARGEDVGLASLFQAGTIGGGLGAGLMGILGALKTPIRTALLALVAPSVGALLGGLTESALNELGADPRVASDFGEAAKLGGIFGMIGLAFAKRVGLVVGAGAGVAASFGDEVLDALGLDKDKMISLFGQEMRLETLASGILGAVGGALSLALTSPKLWNSVIDLGLKGASWIAWKKLFGLGVAGAVIGLYNSYGDEAKDWLKSQGMPDNYAEMGVDGFAFAATGASLGSIFGPTGALVGAALGLAIGLGKTVVKWLEGVRDSQTAAFEAEASDVQDIIARAVAENRDLTIEEARRLSQFETEARRRQQLGLPQPQIEREAELEETARSARGQRPLEPGDTTPAQQSNRIVRAVEGDAAALNELIKYARDIGATTNQQIRDAIIGMGANVAGSDMDLLNRLEDLVYDKIPDTLPNQNNLQIIPRSPEPIQPMSSLGNPITGFDEEAISQYISSSINRASDAAVKQQATSNVTYAPVTIAPVTNSSVRGGTSSTVVNTVGGGRSDLDALSSPWAH